MKKVFLTAVAVFGFAFANAQGQLDKGDLQLNAGLGFSGWGTPVYAGLDYGVSEVITVGFEGSYRNYEVGGIKGAIMGVQGNANYHFAEALEVSSPWDLYGGLSLNYYNWGGDFSKSNYSGTTSFGLGAQLGARYFFSDNFGVNLEFGGGNATSGGKFGITYKL